MVSISLSDLSDFFFFLSTDYIILRDLSRNFCMNEFLEAHSRQTLH